MKDFDQIIQEYFGELTKQELAVMRSYFQEEKLPRNDFFTQTGKICGRLSIVKSGILRVYAFSEGKEITQWISNENFLITEITGFFFDQPGRWMIQAFADTELWTITKEDYRRLCREFPKWNEIEKRFILKCFTMIENRIFTHLSMTADQRYELYFEQNRELFNQVPLQHIASVLGMAPETFSRIRNRRSKNS
jgi:CRP-like cAMP-binding protein